VVVISLVNRAPRRLANGQLKPINLEWQTRLDRDGRHDDLTSVQAVLWMPTPGGDPRVVRRSMRQLIAMTQGVLSTDRPGSAIAHDSSSDHFTPADIAAMELMSGCGTASSSGVTHTR
jgi:hypothetical protein